MKRWTFIWLAMSQLFLFVGCSQVEFFRMHRIVNTNEGDGIVDPCNCSVSCFQETYRQQSAPSTNKLDILFVTDTSGSLNAERSAVADGIKNFVGQLPPTIDFNIGVMLAHGSTSSYAGRLYKASTEPLVLKSTEMDIETIKAHLRTKLTSVATDRDSDGGEEGLFSTAQALKPGFKEDIMNAGLFRTDAALAVVYIADENDICARYPQGVTRVPDPDNKEGPAFIRDCEDITPEAVYAQLKNLKGTLPLGIGGVIYTGAHPVPPSGENEIGYGYIDIIKLNNGVAVDIAGNNITNDLAAIGAQVNGQIHFQTEFQLHQTGVDETTITVFVNGVQVPHTYVASTNTVFIDLNYAVADSEIVIKYCLTPPNHETSF